MGDGDIIPEDETPTDMLFRVAGIIPDIEGKHFNHSEEESYQFAQEMLNLFLERKIVPSTPISTNAGRFEERPLSACSVPPVDLNNDYSEIKEKVDTYHEEGMGTGFALDKADNPIEVLEDLQNIAKTGLEQDEQHRPVGNMV
jgi:ribonucleoside-diphosphate reductase alpha chain